MKKMMSAILLTVTAAIFSGAVWASEGEGFLEAKNSAELAALYEKQANQQNSLINEHERMIDSDFIRKNPSATAQNEMRRHCNAIIKKAKALKEELLSFSEWNKKQRS